MFLLWETTSLAKVIRTNNFKVAITMLPIFSDFWNLLDMTWRKSIRSLHLAVSLPSTTYPIDKLLEIEKILQMWPPACCIHASSFANRRNGKSYILSPEII